MIPFFSIVIVCYQAGGELKKTAESVLRQTDGDFEIVVKDGGSADGSLEALPEDARIRIFTGRDNGIYDAMNRACAEIRGRYVLFLNCGDYFYDEKVLAFVHRTVDAHLRRMAVPAHADENGEEAAYIFYGNTFERKTGSTVMSNPVINRFACYRNVPCHQCCFYDARLLRARECEAGEVYRTRYRVRADYEHFLWCFFRRKARTVYMPLTVCSYEGGGFSESAENLRRSKKEHREITALYMTKAQRFRYRAAMLVTFAPLRTKLSKSGRFSGMYQALKRLVYGKRA